MSGGKSQAGITPRLLGSGLPGLHKSLKMALVRYRLSAILILLPYLSPAFSYNVDTKVPIVKEGNPDSYFGFSVAEHQIDHADHGPTFV